MTRARFLEMLKALYEGWEVEISGLDHCDTWHRFRVSPSRGWFEREYRGQWFPCPLGTAGHAEWRLADTGQPKRCV